MNILLLTQEYPPETGWGGIGTYTRNLARAQVALGHTVHVLSSSVPPRANYSYDDAGVQVHRIPRWRFRVPTLRRVWNDALPQTKYQLEYAFGIYWELSRLIHEHSIEIIEAPEIWAEGLFYQFARSVPIVVKLHTPLYLIRALDHWQETFDWHVVDWFDKRWTTHADALTSASASLAQLVAAKYQLDLQKITVIPVSVDTELFTPAGNSSLEDPLILYVGRLERRKGVFTLADAMPAVLDAYPTARFVFLGADMQIDGRSCQSMLLERMQAQCVVSHAEFVGKVPNAELPRYHHHCTVAVFPSTWENCAVACLEAMACARPVVATNAGGFPEMIRDGENGLLVPPSDPDALAAALKKILANPQRAREWGANARRVVEQNFATEVVARHTLAVYTRTLDAWNNQRRRV